MTTSVYVREKRDGHWRYRCVTEGRGRKTGKIEPPFYIRVLRSGRRSWERLFAETFKEAKEAAEKLVALPESSNESKTRVLLKDAIEAYLELKRRNPKTTQDQYRQVLRQFLELTSGRARFVDEISVDVLREYKSRMEKLLVEKTKKIGYDANTIGVRLNIIRGMLKKNGIAARLERDEKPIAEEEPAEPYSQQELDAIFNAVTPDDESLKIMTPDEILRYKFLLGTGCREREVTFASWKDIDFDKGEYIVRSKPDVGFTVKKHESRRVPLPKSLVKLLRSSKENAPHDRWIFINGDGKPDAHMLSKLKRIAKNAGLNCGHCEKTLTFGKYDKKHQRTVTCKTHPICEHWILHRFRKTCATRWDRNRIPVRTIQAWLGHKKLETTMRYLGVTDAEELRPQIDKGF